MFLEPFPGDVGAMWRREVILKHSRTDGVLEDQKLVEIVPEQLKYANHSKSLSGLGGPFHTRKMHPRP